MFADASDGTAHPEGEGCSGVGFLGARSSMASLLGLLLELTPAGVDAFLRSASAGDATTGVAAA